MRAVRLRTVDLKNPLGIDDAAPMLSWNCEGGKKQRAYQLRVTDAVSGELFFDSGRVESDTMRCAYGGKELKSRTRAAWSVTIWDETGEAETSEGQRDGGQQCAGAGNDPVRQTSLLPDL